MNATYNGDDEYNTCCKGDVCVGDEVRFERATFSGNYRNATFAGYELVTAKVIRDSYGRDKQQHTFTLELPNGKTFRIKGRNLYRNGIWRKKWADENARELVLEEKHQRGNVARSERNYRLGLAGL